MKTGSITIWVILIVLAVGGIGLLSTQVFNKKSAPSDTNQVETTNLVNTESSSLSEDEVVEVVNEETPLQDEVVPLPQEEDIIRNFFSLINEGQIPEAISLMSSSMVGDDTTKQAWGVHFNAIESINAQSIEASMPESWTDNRHTYKVTLETYVSAQSANAAIEYYGWGDNPNIRWVSIGKEGGLWKIVEIATGP